MKLAFVSNNAANFWTIARAGCADAQKELGDVDVDFRIPSTGSAAEQQQILNDLVARGIDGIAVSPIDPANQTDFLNKIASQALLIYRRQRRARQQARLLHRHGQRGRRRAGRRTDQGSHSPGRQNHDLRRQQGRAKREGTAPAASSRRSQGSNVQIIDIRTDDTDAVRAQKNAEDTLVKYPDIACLVGLWNYNGPAILNAVQGADKIGQVKIVCFDENEETLAGVAAGLTFTAPSSSNRMNSASRPSPAWTNICTATRPRLAGGKIFIPTLDIKKDNVADFQGQAEKTCSASKSSAGR